GSGRGEADLRSAHLVEEEAGSPCLEREQRADRAGECNEKRGSPPNEHGRPSHATSSPRTDRASGEPSSTPPVQEGGAGPSAQEDARRGNGATSSGVRGIGRSLLSPGGPRSFPRERAALIRSPHARSFLATRPYRARHLGSRGSGAGVGQG